MGAQCAAPERCCQKKPEVTLQGKALLERGNRICASDIDVRLDYEMAQQNAGFFHYLYRNTDLHRQGQASEVGAVQGAGAAAREQS
mmetsp:Transcript_40519/g.128294  ORF Transcript_40519/g.128294 Transcript_40519/m.128294 type:complete len:86 (-) Transcript_40519:2222-2479(-)